jgi:hypothetical protein
MSAKIERKTAGVIGPALVLLTLRLHNMSSVMDPS